VLNKVSLNEAEECYILRRRLKLHLKDTAQKMNISHVTLIKWEKEGPPNHEYKNFLLEKWAEQEGVA